jgi:hypothetical protein
VGGWVGVPVCLGSTGRRCVSLSAGSCPAQRCGTCPTTRSVCGVFHLSVCVCVPHFSSPVFALTQETFVLDPVLPRLRDLLTEKELARYARAARRTHTHTHTSTPMHRAAWALTVCVNACARLVGAVVVCVCDAGTRPSPPAVALPWWPGSSRPSYRQAVYSSTPRLCKAPYDMSKRAYTRLPTHARAHCHTYTHTHTRTHS